MARIRIIGAALGMAIGLGGCAEQMAEKPMAGKTLYERLGGKPAITAVVDQFVANIAADDRINKRFADTNIPRLKTLLVEQVCEASGGPCTYTGRSMEATHRGMKITNAEFAWTGGHLAAALDKLEVPAREKGELMAAIGSMEGQIVGK